MATWPFVWVRGNNVSKTTLNHEKIHFEQQKELLLIFFYLIYFVEWLIRACIYKNFNTAYCMISFEQEAYREQLNIRYLEKRNSYEFLKYMFKL
jgi:hypothetical protein